jgi:hypothetical protein
MVTRKPILFRHCARRALATRRLFRQSTGQGIETDTSRSRPISGHVFSDGCEKETGA